MNPIIERVARAIAGSAASAFGDRAIYYVENNWGAYTNQARSAMSETFDALSEPTEAMMNVFAGSPSTAKDIWQAMLAQARKEYLS